MATGQVFQILWKRVLKFQTTVLESSNSDFFASIQKIQLISDYRGELLEDILAELASLDNFETTSGSERRLLAEEWSNFLCFASDWCLWKEESSYLVVSAVSKRLSWNQSLVDEGTETSGLPWVVETPEPLQLWTLGLEAKPGETEGQEVRQLMIANMIKAMMKLQKLNERYLWSACRWFEKLQRPSACKSWSTKSAPGNQGAWPTIPGYYVKTVDEASPVGCTFLCKDKGNFGSSIEGVEETDVVKPQDLAMSCYHFLHDFARWTWTAWNWDWIRKYLVVMSFDKFVIYPANCFKTHERLNEYKAFFEPQLDDMAISRNIKMESKNCCSCGFNPTGKAAVELYLATK